MRHTIVMGVCGCGKTTVAKALAADANGVFIEADDLHGQANVEKMRSGVPLTDEDRWPWLMRVAEAANQSTQTAFISCSALRRRYRDYLVANIVASVAFVHLQGNKETLLSRMDDRKGHFMPVELLDSQLALLEPLANDEHGVQLDIKLSVDTLVERYKSQQ